MTDTSRTFDWTSRHDPRSRAYSMRALLGSAPIARRRRLWLPGEILDQGREGACVGFGTTQELLSSPARVNLSKARLPRGWPIEPNAFAQRVYHEAQKIDEWAGEGYSGTSVLAGMKALTGLGLVREYRWCLGREDFADTLATTGPVVVGMTWRQSMYSAPSGIIRTDSADVGGHCILATGYDPAHPLLGEAVRLTNSWGPSWGGGSEPPGCAWISLDDLWPLMESVGEAAVVTRRALAGPRVVTAALASLRRMLPAS